MPPALTLTLSRREREHQLGTQLGAHTLGRRGKKHQSVAAGVNLYNGILALICSSQPRTRMSIISPSGPLYLALTVLLPGHSVEPSASMVLRAASISST